MPQFNIGYCCLCLGVVAYNKVAHCLGKTFLEYTGISCASSSFACFRSLGRCLVPWKNTENYLRIFKLKGRNIFEPPEQGGIGKYSQQHPARFLTCGRGCCRSTGFWFLLLSMIGPIGSDLSQSVRCNFPRSSHIHCWWTDAFGSCQRKGLTNVKVLSHRIPYRRISLQRAPQKSRIAEYSQPHITLRQQVLDPFPLLSL